MTTTGGPAAGLPPREARCQAVPGNAPKHTIRTKHTHGFMEKKRVLVVGANGFTGRRILDDLSQDAGFHAIGCSLHADLCPGTGHGFVQADVTDEHSVRQLFDELHPDVVVNTAAQSATGYCEAHHEEARRINVDAVGVLAACCEQHGAKLIHLSSDFVFGGDTDRPYTEDDTPRPLNYYGQTKLESERLVASTCTDYAIARVVVVYGCPLPGQHGNIVQLVANRLRNNECVRVADDQWRTPTFVDDVAQGVRLLIAQGGKGIYHICGDESLSIADLALRVADVLGLDRSLVLPVPTGEMGEDTPRPRFSSLSIGKARRELGYRPRSIDEGLRLTFGL